MTRRTKRRLARASAALAALAIAAGCAWALSHPAAPEEEEVWTDPLTEQQRALVDGYDDATKTAAELLAASKWQAKSGRAVLTFADDTAVLTSGGEESSRCTWAISSYDAGQSKTASKKTAATLSLLDGEGKTFTMTLTRTYKSGQMQSAELSSSRFASGETFTRAAEAAKATVTVEEAPQAAYELTGIGKDAAAEKVKDWASRNAPSCKKASFSGEAAVTSSGAKIVWKLDDAKATKVAVTLDKESGKLAAAG